MKKIKVLALILCVVLAFGMFAGCGKTAAPAAAAPAAGAAAEKFIGSQEGISTASASFAKNLPSPQKSRLTTPFTP